jgi:hypothetical protein
VGTVRFGGCAGLAKRRAIIEKKIVALQAKLAELDELAKRQ